MKIAFLGLGRMGGPMARRLLDAAHDVTVWNRTESRSGGFPSVAPTAPDAVVGAEIVITMLTDASAVRDVVFASGLTRALRPDAVLADMSTIGPAAARRIHESVPVATLDAPVGGGVSQASSGELTVLAGGDPGVLARVRDVLGVLGEVVHCGGPGAGQTAKLCFNLVLAVTMGGIAEAVALGERAGLSTEVVLRVLGKGGAAPMVQRKGPMIQARDYAPSFALSLMAKDARLVEELAAELGLQAPLAAAAAGQFRRGEGAGLGDGDYAGITELYRA